MTTTTTRKTRRDGVVQRYHVKPHVEPSGVSAEEILAVRNAREEAAVSALAPKGAPVQVGQDTKAELFAALDIDEGDFAETYIIGSQESALIRADRAENRVRGGGVGSGAWLARLTGSNAEYGFERTFIERDTRGLSGSGASGTVHWHELSGDGIYEFRGFAASSRYPASGFVIVRDGKVASLGSRKRAIQKALDAGLI